MSANKITVVGAGHVGATCSQLLAQKELAKEVVCRLAVILVSRVHVIVEVVLQHQQELVVPEITALEVGVPADGVDEPLVAAMGVGAPATLTAVLQAQEDVLGINVVVNGLDITVVVGRAVLIGVGLPVGPLVRE